jgi:hypothetical protein
MLGREQPFGDRRWRASRESANVIRIGEGSHSTFIHGRPSGVAMSVEEPGLLLRDPDMPLPDRQARTALRSLTLPPPDARCLADIASELRSDGGHTGSDLGRVRDAVSTRAEVRSMWSRMRDAVDRSGAVVLRGIELEDHATLIGLTMGLGLPSVLGHHEELVHAVTPSAPASKGEISPTAGAFPLHTDSVGFARPHDYIGLACLRADPGGGGQSRLVHVDDLLAELARRSGRWCVSALRDPVFRFPLAPPESARLGPHRSRGQRVPILSESIGGSERIRYRGDVVRLDPGRRFFGRHRRALAALDATLADPSVSTACSLAPGDVLLIDNRRVLHGRTAIRGRQRLLWRVRLMSP